MRIKHYLKLLGKILLGLFAALAIFLIVLFNLPPYTHAVEIDFTRHLASHVVEDSSPQSTQDSFFGVPGSARLIVTTQGEMVRADIQLNGAELGTADQMNGSGQLEIPVTLLDSNTISVQLEGVPGSSVSLRVKQLANVEMHVVSRVHFNTNVSDFVAAREFYGKLGFTTVSGFPDTNTQAMARAIGIETPTTYDGSQGDHAGGYLLHGELIGLGGFGGGLIDLIEFTIPRDEEPPYRKLNHLGMARAAMRTPNIAADYEYMKKAGVNFISAPATRSDGTVFAVFSDQDGTFYELIEVEGEDQPTETTHITELAQLNINVSDFERSRAWYQLMGYEIASELAATDSTEVARAMGFDEPYEIKGAILEQQSDSSTVELVQWISPYNPESAYPIPVNHLGIHRTAFATGDLEGDVATLKAQGVEFVSEITPCCSGPDSAGSIVAFYDPDGVIVELVGGQPFITEIFTVMRWFSD